MTESFWSAGDGLRCRAADASDDWKARFSGATDEAAWPEERRAGAAKGPPGGLPDDKVVVLDSFVAGLAACAAPPAVAALRAGTVLTLRRPDRAAFLPGRKAGEGRPEVQVWTAEGQPLGRLPPEDAVALNRLAAPGMPVSARVSAVVPAFRQPRVQVRIAFAPAATGEAPPRAG